MPALTHLPLSSVPVLLSRHELRQMLALVRLLYRLSGSTGYRQQVFPLLPEICRFDPGHASLLMGYDFHLSPDGPRLIEVNTNAGGAYIAWLSERQSGGMPEWQKQRLQQRLLASFMREWSDFTASGRPLQRILLMDEEPEEQPLYLEMLAYRDWLREQGLAAEICAPERLTADRDGVFFNGEAVDLLYNRHCDFFLEQAELSGLREAYLAGTVCLSPNPFAYGLLADKRRMILWSDRAALAGLGLSTQEQELLLRLVPQSRLLADCDPEQLWSDRSQLVFKPVTRFGSRGVLLGKKASRKRFAELDPATTLVQQLVPPSVVSRADEVEFKVDLRLFVYRDRLRRAPLSGAGHQPANRRGRFRSCPSGLNVVRKD